MAVNIVTQEDLQKFKNELLAELRQLLEPKVNSKQRKWLKSWEVREMLGISRGTLQNMRINGTLKSTRVGGLMFYDNDEITKLLQGKNGPEHRRSLRP